MRLPEDSHRHVIVGATGTGKTQAALWHLSQRRFDEMPWIVYNWKADELIDDIPEHRDLTLDELPSQPGVYVVRPLPDEDIEPHLWGTWREGNTGIMIDEGYMLGTHNKAFRSLLTQGRSRRVPLIILSQRPVWMDRFVFSEANFYQVFRLQHALDRRNMEQVVPANLERRLPEFHSYYYDVGRDYLEKIGPVPRLPVIYETFRRRLQRQRRAI